MQVYVIHSGDGEYAVFESLDKATRYIKDIWRGDVTQADDDGEPITGFYWITYPEDPDCVGSVQQHIVIV